MRKGAATPSRPLFGAAGEPRGASPVVSLGRGGPGPAPRPLFGARVAGERPVQQPAQKERPDRPDRHDRPARARAEQREDLFPAAHAAPALAGGKADASAPDAPAPMTLDEVARAAAEAAEARAQAEAAREQAAAQAAAMERAQAEAESMRDRYLRGLSELARAQALDFRNLENELSDLAIEIAREILLREIGADRLYVVRLVEAALRVVVEEEAATVLIAPADLALLEQERPRLEVARGGGLVRVTSDPSLHPGDCVVQVGRARIDARLGDRLERVRQALHGVDTETE
jgi:flagellar biosynthesis/type III secretory pathway protein FliH